MNPHRCVDCGFLNFASATSCKRCKAKLVMAPPSEPAGNNFYGGYPGGMQPGYQTATGYAATAYIAPGYSQPVSSPQYFPTPVAPLPRTSKNGGTNALLLSLLCITVVVALGLGIVWKFGKHAPSNPGWLEYKSDDGAFRVEMPVKPLETSETTPTPTGDMQTRILLGSMREKGVYVIAYTDYPPNSLKVSPDVLLDTVAQGAVKESGATMVSKKLITLDGYQGIEVEMTLPPGKLRSGGLAVCRIYWTAPRIYTIFVGGPESSEVYMDRMKFLDSFKLRKKSA